MVLSDRNASNLPHVDAFIRTLKEDIGISNVYFEPPENYKMRYPCVRFQRRRYEPTRADNGVYVLYESFDVVLIYREPDSPLPARMMTLPMCQHDRHYTANNLSHDAFVVYLK